MNITVTGKVQGVFFRASTQEHAKAIGINGWVCNKPDGSVYLEAEGGDKQLRELLAWLERGPRRAVVDSVDAEAGELKNYRDFEIRHG